MKRQSIFGLAVLVFFIFGGVWYAFTYPAQITGLLAGNSSGGAPSGASQPSQPTVQSGVPLVNGNGQNIGGNLTLGIYDDPRLGAYLTGYTGNAVYTFARDQVGTSTCYGTCAQLWPPYTVSGTLQFNLQPGVNQTLVGTITRTDNTEQLTYRGLPLYFYAPDQSASQAKGQGVGGLWYVVTP